MDDNEIVQGAEETGDGFLEGWEETSPTVEEPEEDGGDQAVQETGASAAEGSAAGGDQTGGENAEGEGEQAQETGGDQTGEQQSPPPSKT